MNADDMREAAASDPDPGSPPAGLVTTGYFDERPGYAVHRPRGARNWLFTWTVAGQGRLSQGGVRTEARAGDLVLLTPGVAQHYAVAPGAEHWAFWWAHCPARPSWSQWVRPYQIGAGLHVVSPVPPGLRPRIGRTFQRLHADARWPGDSAPAGPVPGADSRATIAHSTVARELALTGLEEITLLVTAGASAARRPAEADAGGDPRVRRAAALIAADPGGRHTVASLAASVALSPSRLAHLFSEQVGASPMSALRDARLRHAAQLLEATDLPVRRVATAAGFVSPYHFSRIFRERYGKPPSAYRREQR